MDFLTAPLIVAVTGHRDLRDKDRDQLVEVFKEKLAVLQEEVTGETECICLSALAAGADILAARVALDAGWKVIAPMPLPLEMYSKDFEGAQWLEEKRQFEELLVDLKATDGCGYFFIGWAPDCTPENTRDHGCWRNLQYAFVGEYLTRHCEILVAFWDGLPSEGVGGTADVVATQLTGIPVDQMELRRDDSLLDSPEGGRVIQIKTPRQRHAKNGIAEFEIEVLEPPEKQDTIALTASDPIKQQLIQKRLKEIIQERLKKRLAFVQAAEEITPEDPYKQLPIQAAQGSRVLSSIRDSFLRADALAGERQKDVGRLFGLILGAVGVFIFLVGVAGAFEPERIEEISLALSWVFLALAWGISRREKTVKLKNEHEDYRALAEAWRVCFFWRLVGIPTEIAKAYLRHQRGELDWIRQTFNAHDLKARALDEERKPTPEDFQTAYTEWVKGQSEYFRHPTDPDKGKVPGFRKKLTRYRDYSWLLLFGGLCAAAVGTMADLLAKNAFASQSAWGDTWLFARNFLSADRLASPFTPALLLLARMESWPIVTEENTREAQGDPKKDQTRLRLLHEWIQRRNTLQRVLFIGISVLALALACEFTPGTSVAISLRPCIQVVETACFFAPALFFLNADINAIPEHVQSYERMAGIFARAQQMLETIAEIPHKAVGNWANTDTQQRAKRVLEELGREALHENGEWLLIHRDRPLDIEA